MPSCSSCGRSAQREETSVALRFLRAGVTLAPSPFVGLPRWRRWLLPTRAAWSRSSEGRARRFGRDRTGVRGRPCPTRTAGVSRSPTAGEGAAGWSEQDAGAGHAAPRRGRGRAADAARGAAARRRRHGGRAAGRSRAGGGGVNVVADPRGHAGRRRRAGGARAQREPDEHWDACERPLGRRRAAAAGRRPLAGAVRGARGGSAALGARVLHGALPGRDRDHAVCGWCRDCWRSRGTCPSCSTARLGADHAHALVFEHAKLLVVAVAPRQRQIEQPGEGGMPPPFVESEIRNVTARAAEQASESAGRILGRSATAFRCGPARTRRRSPASADAFTAFVRDVNAAFEAAGWASVRGVAAEAHRRNGLPGAARGLPLPAVVLARACCVTPRRRTSWRGSPSARATCGRRAQR